MTASHVATRPSLGLLRRVAAVLAAIAAMLLTSGLVLLNAPASYGAPGNNGTIKVNSTDLASKANDPHVGCAFTIAWFNFDTDGPIAATVAFAQQAPTTDGTMSVTGNLTPTFTATQPVGLDHQESYTLSFTGQPQPQQGFHVKITVNTPRSKGADVKHKVFWVGPCTEPSSSPSPSSSASSSMSSSPSPSYSTSPSSSPSHCGCHPWSPSPSSSVSASASDSASTWTSTSPSPTVLGTEASRPEPSGGDPKTDPTVLGTQAVRPTAVDAGLVGSTAGSPHAALAVALMGSGAALFLAAGWLAMWRRPRGSHES
ncbi:MAG: hypothetical protein ACRDPI_00930 [Nocardioidaceae bacterium]